MHAVVLTGLNGLFGGWNLHKTFPEFTGERVHHVANPPGLLFNDFGQEACMAPLYRTMDALNRDPTVQGIFVHASSQGTATAMNFFGAYPHLATKVRSILLEAVMASGNLTVASATDMLDIPILAPFVPTLASFFPFSGVIGFAPAGVQCTKSAAKWPETMRQTVKIVLLNSRHDRETPFLGACAMAARFTELGFQHVYLMGLDARKHVEVLHEGDQETLSSVRSILQLTDAKAPQVTHDRVPGHLQREQTLRSPGHGGVPGQVPLLEDPHLARSQLAYLDAYNALRKVERFDRASAFVHALVVLVLLVVCWSNQQQQQKQQQQQQQQQQDATPASAIAASNDIKLLFGILASWVTFSLLLLPLFKHTASRQHTALSKVVATLCAAVILKFAYGAVVSKILLCVWGSLALLMRRSAYRRTPCACHPVV